MNKFKLIVLLSLIIPSIKASEFNSDEDYEVVSDNENNLFTDQQLEEIKVIETVMSYLELLYLIKSNESNYWVKKTETIRASDIEALKKDVISLLKINNLDTIDNVYFALKEVFARLQNLKIGQSDLHDLNLINKIFSYSCRLTRLIYKFNRSEILALKKDCTDIESTRLAVDKFQNKRSCVRRKNVEEALLKLEKTKKYIIKKLKKMAINGNLKAVKLIYNTPSIGLTEKQHKKFSEILD